MSFKLRDRTPPFLDVELVFDEFTRLIWEDAAVFCLLYAACLLEAISASTLF